MTKPDSSDERKQRRPHKRKKRVREKGKRTKQVVDSKQQCQTVFEKTFREVESLSRQSAIHVFTGRSGFDKGRQMYLHIQ